MRSAIKESRPRQKFGAVTLPISLIATLVFLQAMNVWAACADDPSFLPQGGAANGVNSTVRALAVQQDGKILLGGDFTGIFGNPGPAYFARVLANGTYEGYVSIGLNGPVYAIAIQPDNKMLLGGE